jgi:transposase
MDNNASDYDATRSHDRSPLGNGSSGRLPNVWTCRWSCAAGRRHHLQNVTAARRAVVGLRVRLTTAFNRILQLPGASVRTVAFTDQGLVIGLHRRRRRLRCPCGATTTARYDTSRRRWRHLDFGACRVWLEADIHRIDCRACGRVRTEQVPWARPNARHSSDFENVVAWLAQRMDKTNIGRLLRCSWEAVDAIVARVVVDHIDDTRLDNLYRIGVDEISYKRGHRFLTIVADHDTGNVVWVGKQRSKTAFEEFFTALGPRRAAAIEAISLDGSSVYLPVTREQIPQARICLDPST